MSHIPRKRFGQHFLHDQNIIDKLIQCIAPKPDEKIIEIGPGLGALTLPLLTASQHLDAIELDRDVIPLLIEKCKAAGELTVHQHDVLKFDFSNLISENKKIRVVGNLPYNISTPLLFHLLNYVDNIQDMHFMLQKEVVDRLAAQANTTNYGRLSVAIQYHCEVTSLFNVSKHAFNPPPKVESAIVKLVPHKTKTHTADDINSLQTITKQAFSQRRKTLRNNLKTLLSAEEITDCGLNPGARAETLTVADFVNLSNQFSRKT